MDRYRLVAPWDKGDPYVIVDLSEDNFAAEPVFELRGAPLMAAALVALINESGGRLAELEASLIVDEPF